MTEDPRQALDRVARENRTSLASLSRLIDRNAAYIQQHITRGKPALLAPEDRQRIADYFGVDVALFGPPPKEDSATEMVRVPRLSVEASAGFGSHADGEFEVGAYGFDQRWLRAVCGARPRDLSIIRVKGDSMTPTLIDGDDVLVDRSDAGTRLRDGLYVLRREDTLMVKRVALAPTARTLTVSSDNPVYPTWSDRPFDSVDVVGRVVWAGRRFG